MRARRAWAGVTVAMMLLAGCGKPTPPPAGDAPPPGGEAKSAPSDPNALRFWHTQTRDNEKALVAIVDEFNKQPGVTKVVATYIGNYDQLFEKVRAGLHAQDASARPDLAVAYESMVAEYMAANAVRPLDDFVADPQAGLDKDSLADIYPSFLEMNRFAAFGGKLLSFPFTKSVLMLYSNQDLLAEVQAKTPETWDDLLAVCRKIKAKHPDIKPFSFVKDASALDGIILSFGGKLLEADGSAGFGSPATVEAISFWATMVKEKLVYEPTDKDKQNADFAAGKTAFFLRSSVARPDVAKLVEGKVKWDASGLPHKAGVKPVTVLFGANICMLASTPEREKAAWAFIKYFASKDVTAKWAAASGYLPVRKSALETQTIKDLLAAAPQNGRPLDILDQAVPEPNVAGWQDVRKCLEKAHLNYMNALRKPDEIAKELDQTADAALAKARGK